MNLQSCPRVPELLKVVEVQEEEAKNEDLNQVSFFQATNKKKKKKILVDLSGKAKVFSTNSPLRSGVCGCFATAISTLVEKCACQIATC